MGHDKTDILKMAWERMLLLDLNTKLIVVKLFYERLIWNGDWDGLDRKWGDVTRSEREEVECS